ncbi:tail fiber protein [Breoghania sp. JC706]|uniref:phage tail protein n=1 Tax=Breoghania sp. JC706 TaxID=3117732 RepID=UPI003009ADED
MSEPFIAEIRIFAGNFAPRGWAFCNGQLLPISQNTALFSLIGTTYGGDGSTTMALPNMMGRSPMHPGRGPGLTSRRLGEKTGSERVTLTEATMPNHRHSVRGTTSRAGEFVPADTMALARSSSPIYQTETEANLTYMESNILSYVGGTQSHENMQPYLVLNFIIALVGLYPSRS